MQIKFILKTLFLINCINIIYANENQTVNSTNQAIINNYNASDDDSQDTYDHQTIHHDDQINDAKDIQIEHSTSHAQYSESSDSRNITQSQNSEDNSLEDNNATNNVQENLEEKIKLLEKNNALLKHKVIQLENQIFNNKNNDNIIMKQTQDNIAKQNEEQSLDMHEQLAEAIIPINKEYPEEVEFNIIKSTNNPQEDYNLLVAQFKEIYLEKNPNSKERNILILQNNLFSFIYDHEKSNLIPNVHYWLAESFGMLSNFSKASFHYLKSFSTYRQLQKANNVNKNLSVNLPEVLLKLAESLVKLNKEKEALSIIDKLKTEFPNDAKNLQARINLIVSSVKNNVKNINKDIKNNNIDNKAKNEQINKPKSNKMQANKASNKPAIENNKSKQINSTNKQIVPLKKE